MNLSFVTKSGKSSERHILEHLMFYRSEKYPEAASFYNYLYRKNITIDFKTVYDYMETGFYNVNKDDMQEIRNIFNSFYFTENDFDLEKRVILIECENYNYENVDTEKELINEKYESLCDKNLLKRMSYQDVLNFKKNFIFTEYVYEDEIFEKSSEVKNLEILKIAQKKYKNNLSFSFKENKYLFELVDILHKCLFLSGLKFGINRVFTLKENTIIFYNCGNIFDLEKNLLKSFLDNFDNAFDLFIKENKANGVQFTLKDFANIKNFLSKQEIESMIKKLIKEICK